MDVFEKQPLCVTLHDLKTKYNENPAIPAYSGIMFDVSSRRDMELIAMEIDIRLDQATTLDVEIFTTAGSFLANIHNESMWTKLADSKATVAPDGRGIIVPEKDFTPLKMKEREKRSFYIQMKGPWIDIRAEALDKTGELQQQSDDLTVFVGVGLNSRFPEDFDKTVDPQFSGVFHYRKSNDCDQDGMSTEIEFLLLVSQPPNTFFLNLVKDTFDDIVRKQLLPSEPFTTMALESSLKIGTSTKVTSLPSAFECPDDWLHCPTVKLIVSFTHEKELRAGQLRYQFLRAKDSIINNIKQKLQIDGILYVGLEPTAASFDMTLAGTSDKLEPEAWDFFERVTAQFLDEIVHEGSDYVTVFDSLTFEESSRRNLRALSGPLSFSGQVYGAQGGFLPLNNFAIQMGDAVAHDKDSLMGMLRIGNHVSPKGHVFSSPAFASITDIRASFSPIDVSSLSLTPDKDSILTTNNLLIIGGVLLAIFIVVFGYYSRRRAKERSKYEEELQEYRDQMRTQRREKREELQQSPDPKDDEEITAESFKSKFADDLEAAFELGYEKYKEALEKLGEDALSADQLVGAETTDGSCSQSKAGRGVIRKNSSASGLSLFLEQNEVQSDLEDDFSDSSSGKGGTVSGAESVASGISRASSKSSRSLLSVFMEKQSEAQKLQGLHMSNTSSVTGNMTANLKQGHSIKSDPLRSQSEHIPKRTFSYMGNQYGTNSSGIRRTVSGDFDVPVGRTRNAGSMKSKSFDGALPGSDMSLPSHRRDPTDPNRELSLSAHSYTGRRIYLTPPSSGSVCSGYSARSTHSRRSNRSAPIAHVRTDKSHECGSITAKGQSAGGTSDKEIQNHEQGTNDPDLQGHLSHRFEHLLPPSAQSNARGNNNTDKEVPHRAISSSSHSTGSVGASSQTSRHFQNGDSCRKLPDRENGTISPRRRDPGNRDKTVWGLKHAAHHDESSEPISKPSSLGSVFTTATTTTNNNNNNNNNKPSLFVSTPSFADHKKGYLQEFLDSDDDSDDAEDDTQVMTSSPSPDKNSPPPKKMTVDDFIHRIELFQQEQQGQQQHRPSDDEEGYDLSSLSGAESLDSIFLDPPPGDCGTSNGSSSQMRRIVRKKQKTKKSREVHSSSRSTTTSTVSTSYDESSSDGDISCTHSLDDNILLHGELQKKRKKKKKDKKKNLSKEPQQITVI